MREEDWSIVTGPLTSPCLDKDKKETEEWTARWVVDDSECRTSL